MLFELGEVDDEWMLFEPLLPRQRCPLQEGVICVIEMWELVENNPQILDEILNEILDEILILVLEVVKKKKQVVRIETLMVKMWATRNCLWATLAVIRIVKAGLRASTRWTCKALSGPVRQRCRNKTGKNRTEWARTTEGPGKTRTETVT